MSRASAVSESIGASFVYYFYDGEEVGKENIRTSLFELVGAIIPVLNCMLIFMETVDGPNQHAVTYDEVLKVKIYRENSTETSFRAVPAPKYPWLPTIEVYYLIQLILLAPIYIDNTVLLIKAMQRFFRKYNPGSAGDSDCDSGNFSGSGGGLYSRARSLSSDDNDTAGGTAAVSAQEPSGDFVFDGDISGASGEVELTDMSSSLLRPDGALSSTQEEGPHRPTAAKHVPYHWRRCARDVVRGDKVCEWVGLVGFFVVCVNYLAMRRATEVRDALTEDNYLLNLPYSSFSTENTVCSALQLLLLARTYVTLRKLPDVLIVEKTILNCIRALLLPWALLLLSAVLIGTLFLFLEPCYNITNINLRYTGENNNGSKDCVWIDVMDAAFYSLTTVVTIGYGVPQVPETFFGRTLAVACMLLGALFLVLPMAIVRSNYQRSHVRLTPGEKAAADAANEKTGASGADNGSISASPDDFTKYIEFDAIRACDGDRSGCGGTVSAQRKYIPLHQILQYRLIDVYTRRWVVGSGASDDDAAPVSRMLMASLLRTHSRLCMNITALHQLLAQRQGAEADARGVLLQVVLCGSGGSAAQSVRCCYLPGGGSATEARRRAARVRRWIQLLLLPVVMKQYCQLILLLGHTFNYYQLHLCGGGGGGAPRVTQLVSLRDVALLQKLKRRPAASRDDSRLAVETNGSSSNSNSTGSSGGGGGAHSWHPRSKSRSSSIRRGVVGSLFGSGEEQEQEQEELDEQKDARGTDLRVGRSARGGAADARYTQLGVSEDDVESPLPVSEELHVAAALADRVPKRLRPYSTSPRPLLGVLGDGLLIFTITLSVVLFVLSTAPYFQDTGESTTYCEVTVEAYCRGLGLEGGANLSASSETVRQQRNAGCFVVEQGAPGTGQYLITQTALKFHCQDADCYGHGFNFGTDHFGCSSPVNVSRSTADALFYETASDADHAVGAAADEEVGGAAAAAAAASLAALGYELVYPFQTQVELKQDIIFGSERYDQTLFAVCDRLECSALPATEASWAEVSRLNDVLLTNSTDDGISQEHSPGIDISKWFLVVECGITLVFMLELVARCARYLDGRAVNGYGLGSWMFLWDVLAVCPLLVETIYIVLYGVENNPVGDRMQSAASIAFAAREITLISSLPMPLLLKLFKFFRMIRLFKMYRYFRVKMTPFISAVRACVTRMVQYFSLLMLLMIPLAYVFYILERGIPCYAGAGNAYCGMSGSSASNSVYSGQIVMINPHTHHYIYSNSIFNDILDSNVVVSVVPNALYSFWFSLVTVTSVGYGDITPTTYGGQLITVVIILIGTIYSAIPLSILIDTYLHEFQENADESDRLTAVPVDKVPETITAEQMKSTVAKINHDCDDIPITVYGDLLRIRGAYIALRNELHACCRLAEQEMGGLGGVPGATVSDLSRCVHSQLLKLNCVQLDIQHLSQKTALKPSKV